MADDDDDGVVVTVVVVRRCATHGFHVGGRKCVEQMQRTWTETESESVFSDRPVRTGKNCPRHFLSNESINFSSESLDWSCNIRVGQSTKGNLLKFMDDVTMSVASQKVQGSILWRITSQLYNTSYRRIKCSTFLKDCSELFGSAGPSATV